MGYILRILVSLPVICFLAPLPAQSFDRSGTWNAKYDPSFPVVRVYGCPGRYRTYFPNFPWANILNQAESAMNEWFTGGGADVRMRYEGDLNDDDTRCVSTNADDGTILLTAQQTSGDDCGYGGAGALELTGKVTTKPRWSLCMPGRTATASINRLIGPSTPIIQEITKLIFSLSSCTSWDMRSGSIIVRTRMQSCGHLALSAP